VIKYTGYFESGKILKILCLYELIHCTDFRVSIVVILAIKAKSLTAASLPNKSDIKCQKT